MRRASSRREFLKTAAAGLAMAHSNLTLGRVWAGQDGEPRKLAHLLSNETYSLRTLFAAGKMTLLTTAGFHKQLGIKGVSLNDMFFRSWDKSYLDRIRESFKASGRVVTCLIMEGDLATANEAK